MMGYKHILAAAGLALTASACVSPVGPVEVTRFHAPETVSQLGSGTVAIIAGPNEDPDSLEFRTYAAAVSRQLRATGYTIVTDPAAADYRALVSFDRFTRDEAGKRSPVSVGVGGSTGSYGSGLGIGIGINLSGAPKPMVISELFVALKTSGDIQNLWEGRAISEAKQGSPNAETALSAQKLAESLFVDFPGESGETIEVE